MADWKTWVTLLGGVLALVGQWWGASYWLPAIGGILAIIGAIGMMKGN